MINQIQYIITTQTNPYENLALEEYLLEKVGDNEVILYLWQNEKTVVIGKNQNPWKECRIKELTTDGGRLVRRLSGGGAVFHDMGNLNFTFLATKENYDVDRQMEVILKAVNNLGIPAIKTGRNDITVEDRKFSGNAFYSDGNQCYHHGTLLVEVDMSKLSTYLNVSRDKLVSKGVASVKSRVVNLKEYHSNLDIDRMKKELIQAFGQVYGLVPNKMELSQMNPIEIEHKKERFASWEWNFGKKQEFNYSFGKRFTWGDIDIKLQIESGVIKECVAYSDALETSFFEQLPIFLLGCTFHTDEMIRSLKQMQLSDDTIMIQEDIISLIREERL
ncbi:lipoate--protein ligase [Mobilitalea sibirica]|uniref:lipoate--protein ligase n=1 Tax=Mobilitalea sibirica TaxID=1462919 RepID=A0A8J7HBK9_9FIRM|nr:lipoate--protein ligase [Mobilitalea sibirica]MBH1940102.1 lipoate--protein ligase [Mobilitalea sibirica]